MSFDWTATRIPVIPTIPNGESSISAETLYHLIRYRFAMELAEEMKTDGDYRTAGMLRPVG